MSSIPSTPSSKIGRPASFTPRRPLSSSSSTSSLTFNSNSTPSVSRATTPLLASTHKKYKAPLSAESRPRSIVTKPRTTLAPVPGSPTRAPTSPRPGSRAGSRPGTPGSPRKGEESSELYRSEMDVSNVDPEAVLVDSATVEPGDVSVELDEDPFQAEDFGTQDKVMVSIRLRPTESQNAWMADPKRREISLDPAFARNHPNCNLSNPSTSSSTPHASSHSSSSGDHKYRFSSILLGSPNKPIYNTVAKSHVRAAMEGYNAVIFAYGQTASGKTYTLSGDEELGEPGIIPRAMRDVFGFIKRNGGREYLLRCSYLEIYNETIYDLLAPPGSTSVVQISGSGHGDVILTPLREEVITSLKGVKEVLKRGTNHRRTACTDWNERSSRSHSVFRLVVESREREAASGRATPGGRATPSGRATPALGGPRLQARDGRSVQMSVLSLIDLAGSEKATSDKDRTREGRYINTSLLTLGTVIGTLADNAARNKSDHIPYRNSKLTRLLAPSLSGNARISVICTLNPDPSAISESTSTLLFAKRVAGVKLSAKKKILEGDERDMEALIERYRKEIGELRRRLEEKENLLEGEAERESKGRKRRLSKQEKQDESQAMRDLQNRIQQLTKLILTSQTIDEGTLAGIGEEAGEGARPVSPTKTKSLVDFDMTPYQLQQELLSARLQLETQSTQILSLEAALEARASCSTPIPVGEGEGDEKDKVIAEQTKTIRELENVVRGYEGLYENAQPPKKLREDVEREMEEIWKGRVEEEKRKREEKEKWADEVVRQLEKERKLRTVLEDERRALAAFVTKFDSLGLSGAMAPTIVTPDDTTTSLSKSTSSLASLGSGLPSSRRASLAAGRRSSSSAFSLASSTSTLTGRAPRASLGVFPSAARSVSGGPVSSVNFPTTATPKAPKISLGKDDTMDESELSSNARLSTLSTTSSDSPIRIDWSAHQSGGTMGSLLEEEWVGVGDASFEGDISFGEDKDREKPVKETKKVAVAGKGTEEKENLPVKV